MTTEAQSALARVVLPPYTPDPDRIAHRRLRWLLLAAVCVFCLFYGFAFALLAPALMLPLIAPLPVFGLVAIWALPETGRAPERSLWILCCAFFVGLAMWPNYIALAPPGLPWITMVRLTGFPMVLTLLVCISMSEPFRRRVAFALTGAPLLWRALLLFVLIQFVSIGFSKQPGQSLDRFIVAQVSWTSVFFISAYVFTTPGRVEKMAGLLWAMAIPIGIIAALEWRHTSVLWAGHIPHFLQIDDPSVQQNLSVHHRSADGIYRAEATFSTPLGLSEYMALIMPMVLQFAFGDYKQWVRGAALASIPFVLIVVYLSGSRLGAVGCLLSFMLYLGVWAALRWRHNTRNLMGPTIILGFPVLVAIVGAATFFIGRLHQIVWGTGSAAASTEARKTQLHLALPKLLHHPWGYGISMGGSTVGFTIPNGTVTLDSYYITIAIEYGVLGFIVYFSMLAIAIFYCAKYSESIRFPNREIAFLRPLSICIFTFLVVKSVFSQQDNHPIVFMYMGMIAALCARAKLETDRATASVSEGPRPLMLGRLK